MMQKSAQPGEGGGFTPNIFHCGIFTKLPLLPSLTMLWCVPHISTLPLYVLCGENPVTRVTRLFCIFWHWTTVPTKLIDTKERSQQFHTQNSTENICQSPLWRRYRYNGFISFRQHKSYRYCYRKRIGSPNCKFLLKLRDQEWSIPIRPFKSFRSGSWSDPTLKLAQVKRNDK